MTLIWYVASWIRVYNCLGLRCNLEHRAMNSVWESSETRFHSLDQPGFAKHFPNASPALGSNTHRQGLLRAGYLGVGTSICGPYLLAVHRWMLSSHPNLSLQDTTSNSSRLLVTTTQVSTHCPVSIGQNRFRLRTPALEVRRRK